MRLLPTGIFVLLMCAGLLSCTKDEEVIAEGPVKSANSTIVSNDLVGHWMISRMKSDTPVDLNNDNIENANLLQETDCFNNMSITFSADYTFTTNNATMTFEAGTNRDEFSCLQDRIDNGKWEVEGDELILYMVIDGSSYTHRKTLVMENNVFSFNVTKLESEQYVNDPGTTQASSIRILELEYAKQ